MADAKIEFTNISRLTPESIGEPGKRTFRILADSESSSAVLWLEKEHLLELAMGIQQLLANMPEATAEGDIPPEREAPGLTRLDFRLSKLALGHDGRNSMFFIDAYDPADANQEEATIRIWANRVHLQDFAEEALNVCAAGRPLCPLCGRAIDSTGHTCPRLNGHFNLNEETE